MPIPTFKFNKLTRTDLLQFDGVDFVNVPVYAVGKNVMWGPEGVGYNSLIVGDVTKNISLVGHKHTTNDILGLQELINELGVNSGTSVDLSNYLLTSTFIDHLNNINSAKHVTQAHLDKLDNLTTYWQLDDQGNLYTTYNTYSTKGLSAFGLGEDGGGGSSGGGVDMLDDWTKYTEAKADYYVTASLLVPFRNDTLSRLTSLESGGGGGDGSVTSVGLSVPTGLSVTGSPITSSGTFAISLASGYSIPTTTKQTQWDTAYSQRHTHTNKVVIDALTQGNIDVLNKLSLDAQGNVKVDATLWATGGVSALGLGEEGGGGTEYILPTASATTLGGIKVGNGLTISSGVLSVVGGGGGSNVTWGTESGGYVPLTVESVSKSVALSTHTHSQYASTTHTHSGVYEPVFTKNAAFNKAFGTAVGTVAQGNDSRIVNGQTAYGWGNHASAGYALNTALTAHINKVDNPHSVTKAQVGLESVDNTADSAKNVLSATKLTTARNINGVSFNGSANITITASTTATLTRGSYLTGSNFNGSTATTWAVDATSANTVSKVVARDASGNFSAGTITAALSGNASTATKLGTATVGSTQLPFYLNAGTATAITQANLRIGLFGTTAIGSTQLPIYLAANGVPTAITQANLRIGLFGATAIGSATAPIYIAANGIPTASTSFGGVTGIGTASPLMDGTVAVGTSTLAARQDHRHPVDTSRAAVGQIMYIGTTAVAINRASATLNLTGIGSLAMAGALTGATTITASTSVATPKVIFNATGWTLEQTSTELRMLYNGSVKQRFLNDGSIAATGELTAYVAGASGYSEFLPLSGGTLTGNLNIGTGVIIGTSTVPLSVRGNAFKYNNSDVLYKGNIGTASLPSIGLSEGWTIEIQTTPSALLIKKNGVIKGTFNG